MKRMKLRMWTEKIIDNLNLVYYDVQMKIYEILKYQLPQKENRNRMQTEVNKIRSMLKMHVNRAPLVIEEVQETFLCKRGKEKT